MVEYLFTLPGSLTLSQHCSTVVWCVWQTFGGILLTIASKPGCVGVHIPIQVYGTPFDKQQLLASGRPSKTPIKKKL